MADVTLASTGRIEVSGGLHFADAVAACAAGKALIAAAPGSSVEISLAGLGRINSASAAVLLEWQRVAQAGGKRLSIQDVPEQLAGILRLSGLDDVLPVAQAG